METDGLPITLVPIGGAPVKVAPPGVDRAARDCDTAGDDMGGQLSVKEG